LKDFLEYNSEKEKEKKDYYLKMDMLCKERSNVMDIVTLESNNTNCFTTSYWKLLKGSGSILLTDSSLYKVN
jgi:hypothetical protein